jgi:hypothetical protein
MHGQMWTYTKTSSYAAYSPNTAIEGKLVAPESTDE